MNRDWPCLVHVYRHGKTKLNAEHRFRGRLDVPLSADGRTEALDAALRATDAGFAAIYTSPLVRAREVAWALSRTNGGCAVEDLEDLVNLDYGRWGGLTRPECAENDPEEWHRYRYAPEDARCPGGERLAAAGDRIVRALHQMGDAHRGARVAAVSHGVVLRLAVLRLCGPSQYDWQFAIPTGSALIFEVDNDAIRLVSPIDRSIAKPEAVSEAGVSG